MARYKFLLLLSIFFTPIQAQIKKCEILHLTDAVVISEYLPRSLYRLDSLYVEGNHYIYHYGRKMIFKLWSGYNKYLTDHYEANVDIPECLRKTNAEDPILDYLNYNYSYDLRYSEHERNNQEIRNRLDSNDFYTYVGKKKIYVAYSFSGEIVIYKMKRKILLCKGFKEPEYTSKPIKSSKFAVLKKAESLRTLTMEEANAMNLKKVERSYIRIFRPE